MDIKSERKKKSLSQKYIFGVKAIANYLNVSERNVYIWEQELGFPLHRVGDAHKRTVYASVDEIERWLRKRPSSKRRKKGKKNIILGISLFLAVVVVFILVWFFLIQNKNTYDFFVSPSPDPTMAVTNDRNVYIENKKGEVIWNYAESNVPLFTEETDSKEYLDFFDIDNDQANEVISREYDYEKNQFYLTLFDNNGSRIWQKSIINDQSFRGLILRSNFFPVYNKFARSHKKTFILTAWRHRTRFLVIIARYDINGNLLNEYIQTGHLSFLIPIDLNKDGTDEVVFGATNNLLNGEAVLGVLDLKNFRGVCPPNRVEPEYQHLKYLLQKYIADEAEPGNQITYIRFKKTNRFRDRAFTYDFPVFDHSDGNLFHIYIHYWNLEDENTIIGFEYAFSNRLALIDIIPTAHLRKFYSKLCEDEKEAISLQELTRIYTESACVWQQGKWIPMVDLDLDMD